MSSLVERRRQGNRFSSARLRCSNESYLAMSDEKWSIQQLSGSGSILWVFVKHPTKTVDIMDYERVGASFV